MGNRKNSNSANTSKHDRLKNHLRKSVEFYTVLNLCIKIYYRFQKNINNDLFFATQIVLGICISLFFQQHLYIQRYISHNYHIRTSYIGFLEADNATTQLLPYSNRPISGLSNERLIDVLLFLQRHTSGYCSDLFICSHHHLLCQVESKSIREGQPTGCVARRDAGNGDYCSCFFEVKQSIRKPLCGKQKRWTGGFKNTSIG